MELNGNIILTPQSSAPGSPVEGQVYYDSTRKAVQMYDGSAFLDVNKTSFMYIVGDILAFTGAETLKKTITFNKAVDYLEITFAMANTTAAQTATLNLYKGGTQLVATTDFQLLPSISSYTVSTNSIVSAQVGSAAPFSTYICRVLVKTSFAVNDTLLLKTLVSANTGNIWDLKIFGYKNKSTNTEFVSVA